MNLILYDEHMRYLNNSNKHMRVIVRMRRISSIGYKWVWYG